MRRYLNRGLAALSIVAGLLFAAFALTSQPIKPHSYFAEADFLVIAHRGGAGLRPENTIAAFAHSADLGVDVLDMDLRQSKDGALIILHDRKVDRTTDGHGRADSLTLAQLQSLDAGYRFSADDATYPFRGKHITIPTLGEVFTAFPQMRFVIEIKEDSDVLALAFCNTIKRYNFEQQVLVASFRDRPLETFRRACPQVATSAAFGAGLKFTLLHWLRLDAAYHPAHQAFQFPQSIGGIALVDRRYVQRAHAHNVEVYVWTVNDTADMRPLIDIGIDGLTTDNPDRLLKTLYGLPYKEEK